MTRINDQVMGEIAAELDNSDQIQSGILSPNLQSVLDADEFRRQLVQITEVGVPDAVNDTFVIIRIRTGFRYRVDFVSWQNQQPGSEVDVTITISRTDPSVANFGLRQGNATINDASKELIVGPMSQMAPTTFFQQRPGSFIVPSVAELTFDCRKTGGGILEAGAQILELMGTRLPAERSWDRFRAQTVLVG